MPVVLSIDTSLSSQEGVHLKWEISGLTSPLKEASLIMTKTGVSDSMSLLRLDPLVSSHSLLNLDLATEYVFIIQVVDSADVVEYSNTLSTLTRTTMTAPVIKSIYGIHDGLVVELEPSSNTLSEGDKVEFVLRKNRTELFFIVKDYSADRVYTLSAVDNVLLSNNNLYKVACMFQPANGVASDLSTSVDAEPTNLPNVPTIVSLTDPDEPDLSLDISYSAPVDFAEWSDNYSVNIYYSQSSSATPEEMDKLTFAKSDADAQNGFYRLSVPVSARWYIKLSYTNRFGEGEIASSNIYIKGIPDNYPSAPVVNAGDASVEVVAPLGGLDDNGSPITQLDFEINRVTPTSSRAIFSRDITEDGKYTFSVVNGDDYNFRVRARNAVGASAIWSPVSATVSAHGEPSLVLASVVDKTITVSYSPNGLPLKSLQCVAIDTDPSTDELTADSMLKSATVSSDRTGTQTYAFEFTLSSAILKYIVISTNDDNNHHGSAAVKYIVEV